MENIGEEEEDIGTKLKFDDRKAIPNVVDAEKENIQKEQVIKSNDKPKVSVKQTKQPKSTNSTAKPLKEEKKVEILKEQTEEQPSKSKKTKKWKDIRLGTLELTEENINPIIKALKAIEDEEAKKEKELMERAGIKEGMIKTEETEKPSKEGEKGEKKEEEEISSTPAAPPLPVSEKEKKKLAKLKKKAKAKGKKLPKKIDKGKEEEKEKKKKEKVKKQYTPIEYREVAGYQVPKGLTSRMIEKIYSQQLYRNNYTPLTKPVAEYINDKTISITNLPTVGIAFERIRRYAIGKNKDQPKRIWVDYFIKRCYEEGKSAYAMKIARILTKNFFDFSSGMSSMILDTIGMYKSVCYIYLFILFFLFFVLFFPPSILSFFCYIIIYLLYFVHRKILWLI